MSLQEEIMQEDDRIDEINNQAVREIYIKQRIWKHTREYLKRYTNPFGEKGEKELDRLKRENTNALISVINRYTPDLETKLLNKLDEEFEDGNYYKEDIINALFDILTKDEFNQEEATKIARKKLKQDCRGCIGMPRVNLIRDLLKQKINLKEK